MGFSIIRQYIMKCLCQNDLIGFTRKITAVVLGTLILLVTGIVLHWGGAGLLASQLASCMNVNYPSSGQALCILSHGDAAYTNLYSIPSHGAGDKLQQSPPAKPLHVPDTPQRSYVDIARQAAQSVGINPDLFVRQIRKESSFNPGAISPAGAVGIAQFLPTTAANMGVDPYNPTQSLYGAARLMAHLSAMYGGNYAMALAAYNAGPGNVQYAINTGGSNWRAYLPAETQNYIAAIMG
ncbi:MAG TPA: lytic transglycosylase domain-containing protein [Ktedonobacteraceae bacterium]|nr:lytic transglycosylase domain-containing protein [Ktedonobacteraceae bacterium]